MAGHSKWANIRVRKGAQGEAGIPRMHLTCIRAAERRHTEVAAGVFRSLQRRARDGMYVPSLCGAQHPQTP